MLEIIAVGALVTILSEGMTLINDQGLTPEEQELNIEVENEFRIRNSVPKIFDEIE